MMKKHFLSILFICITSISFSQIHEVGFFVGGSKYIGDVGSTSYLLPTDFSGGLIYKYNYNPRIAFRGSYNYVAVSGDDADSSNPFRLQRGVSFTNNIHEFAVGMEYNFFNYNISEHDQSYSPYIHVGVAAFSYKTPVSISDAGVVDLTNATTYAIPFGVGYKGRVTDNIAFAIETNVRYAFTDQIDYSKDLYAPNNLFSNLDYAGTGNDWYTFTGLSIVYTFGRPPCYTDAR